MIVTCALSKHTDCQDKSPRRGMTETRKATLSCWTREHEIVSVSSIYCDADMLTHRTWPLDTVVNPSVAAFSADVASYRYIRVIVIR